MHCWNAGAVNAAGFGGELLCFNICPCVSFRHPYASHDSGLIEIESGVGLSVITDPQPTENAASLLFHCNGQRRLATSENDHIDPDLWIYGIDRGPGARKNFAFQPGEKAALQRAGTKDITLIHFYVYAMNSAIRADSRTCVSL
jgi:hypothetical protein